MKKQNTSAGSKPVESAPLTSARARIPGPGGMDWAAFDALTPAEVVAAARTDPDNPPMTKAQASKMRRVSLAKFVRHKLGMSQETFAASFGIPIGTLRDWEQHRTEPDQANKNYLRVILANPKVVQKALALV